MPARLSLSIGLCLGLLFACGTALAGDFCFICQKEIRFSIYTWSDKVTRTKVFLCENCLALPDNCYLCSIPVMRNTNAIVLPDDRVICKRDAKSVVLDDREAAELCARVKWDLDRHLIRFMTFPETNVTVQLMDRVKLQELFKIIGNDFRCPNVLGCTETKTNEARRTYQISILSGQPREDMMTTCVHEYTHAWIFDNVSTARQKTLGGDAVEGFCELLSYLFAEQQGLAMGKSNILANTYTRGQIHLFIAANQQYGLADIIDWMKDGDDALLLKDLSRVRRLADAPKPKATPTLPLPTVTNVAPVAIVSTPAELPKTLKLQGVVWAAHPTAMINGYNIAPNQELSINLDSGPIRVRCLTITPQAVTLQTNASPELLELKLK